MDALALLDQAMTQYRLLDQLGKEIEQTIQRNELVAVPELCAQLKTAQEQAKDRDATLLDLLRQHGELREHTVAKEWLQLMQGIQERNQRLLPRLKSIMAIQRSELHTMKKGTSMLQGYKPGLVQTGRRISSSG